MSTATRTTPPDAPSATQGDEAALRDLLRRRQALFPALRGNDCPQETFDEYLAVCRGIMFIQLRMRAGRFYAIKAEVGRETDAAPPRAVAAPGKEDTDVVG